MLTSLTNAARKLQAKSTNKKPEPKPEPEQKRFGLQGSCAVVSRRFFGTFSPIGRPFCNRLVRKTARAATADPWTSLKWIHLQRWQLSWRLEVQQVAPLAPVPDMLQEKMHGSTVAPNGEQGTGPFSGAGLWSRATQSRPSNPRHLQRRPTTGWGFDFPTSTSTPVKGRQASQPLRR